MMPCKIHRVLVLLLCLLSSPIFAGQEAWLIDINGPIGPATADHVIRGMERAQASEARLVILRIDTPGGLDSSMRDINKAILASPVPVVGYVSPSGARAASAGTYLLYATHIAAMAPGTNLGAATPVQIGGPGILGKGEGDEGGTPQPSDTMERKIVNDAVAYIQSLAQLRGRNADWAEKAVRLGASLSAEDALELKVIDMMAVSTEALLDQLHGLDVLIEGQSHVLETKELAIKVQEIDWRSEFLAVITNPNIAYMLMLVGIYGLIIEFSNPGLAVPGIVGAVSLMLALYAFQVLPVSYAGLGLMLLGIVLMTAEAFAPSFGVLGLGGIIAFVIGSIMLMETDLPGYRIAMPVIVAFALFNVGLLVFALGLLLKARRQKVVSGLGHLMGLTVVVESLQGGKARVRADGELWNVTCDQALAEGDTVIVQAVDGVTLKVDKKRRISDAH
jgi:membrane-bound serine protease (ClpP class)